MASEHRPDRPPLEEPCADERRAAEGDAHGRGAVRALRRDRALDVLVEDSPDVVVVHDGIEILYINRTGEARFGAGAAALVGRSIWEFVPESYRAPLQSRVAEMLATGRPAPTIEVPMSHLDGTGTWGEMVCSPLRFRGEPAIQTVIRDISERKRAEAALERTQERYRELFDAVPIGLYRSTADGRLLEANRALVDILRFPDRETLLGTRTPLLYADPEERAAWIAEAIRNGVVNGREIRLYTHDGELRTLRLNCRVRRDAEGRARSFEGSLEDVTERNRMEQELRRSEQRLDLALSGSGFGLWDWDVPTGRIFADDRWFTMLGFAPHEFPLDVDTWIALVHPDDRGRVSAALDAHFAGESPHYECEIRIRTREGGWRWVLDRGRVVERDPEGHPLRATGTHTDIQDRKQAEEALRRSEERLATIVRAAPLGITLTRAVDGVFMEVNETFAEVLGYDREALLGASAIDLGIWQKTSEREAAIAVLREEGRLAGRPVQFRTRDGELRTFLLFSELLEVEGLPCALTLHQDVTEARQLEAQLLQAQKMEAVGRLAGGIAHDFNNLLTAITGHVEFLLDALPEGDPRRDDAGGIRDSADRAKRLTRQLLAFSRQQVLNPRVVDLAEVVVSFEPLLSRIIGEDVALSVSRPEGRCPVRVDPGQLEQVVLNLVVNARDAMPDGGSLVIAADSIARRDQPTEGFRRPVPAGAYARLRVSDSGSGMDAATRDHIFEPFFTTKPAGKGTGLGLSTVYGIVSQSGGHVGVESGLDRGTTFTLLFPLVEESSAPADPAPRALPPREPDDTRSGSVLVVEDEDAVRLLARRVLDRAGYRVRAAPSGAEALRLADRAGPFDLVLTDMVMPGMSGRELVDHLRGDGRRLRVLYMSGYTADEVVRDGQNRNGSFLEKPFTPAELVRAVQEALGTSAS